MTSGTPRTDTATLGESIQRSSAKGVIDTSSVEEALAVDIGSLRTDTAALGESLAGSQGVTRNESSTLAASVLGAIDKEATETAGVGETVQGDQGLPRTDAPELQESADLGFPRSNNALLAESLVSSLGLTRNEASSLAESIVGVIGKEATETAGVGETVQETWACPGQTPRTSRRPQTWDSRAATPRPWESPWIRHWASPVAGP